MMTGSNRTDPRNAPRAGDGLPGDPEFDFLVALCRTEVPPPQPVAVDWAKLLRLAERHRIEGLLARALLEDSLWEAPPEVVDRLRDLKKCKVLTYLRQLAESLRITNQLDSQGIRAIVLKGCGVAETLYRRQPSARESIDIDLLVSPMDFPTADSLLISDGYVRLSPDFDVPPSGASTIMHLLNGYEYVHPDTGLKIELHYRLLANPDLMNVPFDVLEGRCIELVVGGGRLRTLAGNALIVFLSAHAAEHACFRLKWLADVARAFSAAPIDTQSLMTDAKSWGCELHVRVLAELGCINQIMAGGTSLKASRIKSATEFCTQAMRAEAGDATHRLSDIPQDLRKLSYLIGLQTTARARAYPLVRLLTNIDDVRLLGLGLNWLPLYCLVGRPLALGRLLRRSLPAWALGGSRSRSA